MKPLTSRLSLLRSKPFLWAAGLACGAGAVALGWWAAQPRGVSAPPARPSPPPVSADRKAESPPAPNAGTSAPPRAVIATAAGTRILPYEPPPVKWGQPSEAEKLATANAKPTLRTSLRFLDLSRPPTEQELREAGQLGDDLNPSGPANPADIQDPVQRKTQEADNLLFGQAIQLWNKHEYADAVALFRRHRESYPDSPWAAEAEMHCGCEAQYRGRYDESAFSFDWIMEHTEPGTDMHQKALLRRGVLHMDQGQLEQAVETFRRQLESENRPNRATYASDKLRELALLKGHQTALRDCGQQAMAFVCETRGQAKLADEIRATPASGEQGFKASELVALAQSRDLKVAPVWADSVSLPKLTFPFLAHYKDQHYVAVKSFAPARLEVEVFDPRLATTSAMSLTAFSRQWSGLAILFGEIPGGSGAKPARDLDGVVGGCCGLPRYPSDLGSDGCPKNCGMPGWNINMVSMNHYIGDVPMWHQPAYGPPVAFELSYNSLDSLVTVRPFGEKWVLNYHSYAMEDPSGTVLIVGTDARGEYFRRTTTAGVYKPDPGVFKALRKPDSYTFEVEEQDGTVYRYAVPVTMAGNSAASLLVSITDRHGASVQIHHNAYGAITSVTHSALPGQSWQLIYSPTTGRLDRIEDPFGRIARFLYDAQSRLTGQTDMGGVAYSYTYEEAPQLFVTAIQTPSGTTSFDTEPSDNDDSVLYYPPRGGAMWANYRITVTDALGQMEEYFYDGFHRKAWHRPKKGFDPEATASTVSDGPRWISTPTESSGKGVISSGWSPVGRSLGKRSNFDANRLPRTVEEPNKLSHYYTYNDKGRVLTHKDPSGNTSTSTYESNDVDLKTVSHSVAGVQLSVEYFPSRDIKAVTDALNRVTHYTWNAHGQPVTVTRQVSDGASPPAPRTETLSFTYGADDRLTSVTRNGTSVAQFTWDAKGRLASETDESGYTLIHEYDDLDRRLKTTYPDGTSEIREYSCCTLTRQVHRDGRQVRYTHDALKRLTSVTGPGDQRLHFAYDADDNLIELADAKGQTTRWGYDADGLMTTKTYPDATTETFTYNSYDWRLRRIKNRSAVTTSLYYDSLHRLSRRSTPGMDEVSYTYDALSRLKTLADGTGTTTYTYDVAHRLSSVDGPFTNDTLTYAYDELDRLLSRSVNGQVFESYRYDPQGRVAQLTNALGTLTPTYAGASARATGITTAGPDGSPVMQAALAYAGAAGDMRLTQLRHTTAAGALLSQHDYAYAPAGGSLTSWTQRWGASAARMWRLGHDLDDQLTTVEARDAAGALLPGQSEFYTYDLAGNRASAQRGTRVTQDTHNSLNQLLTRVGGGPVRLAGRMNEPGGVTVNGHAARVNEDQTFESHLTVPPGQTEVAIKARDTRGNETSQVWRFTTQSGATFSAPCEYDASGNLTARHARQEDGTIKVYRYEWDPLARLKAVTVGPETAPSMPANGALRTEWTYDGQSRRVRQVDKVRISTGLNTSTWSTIKEVTFLWDGTQILQRRAATGATVQVDYFSNGELRRDNGGAAQLALHHTQDHLGSIRELVDGSGTVRARYDYDAWGRRTKLSGDLESERGFTGHRFHEPSGLHLALYRAYDPELGRWLSADPIGERGGINLYEYVNNRPVTHRDPNGETAVAGVVVPVIVVVAIAATAAYMMSDTFHNAASQAGAACSDAYRQVEEQVKELLRKNARRQPPEIWYNYSPNPTPFLVTGDWVTDRGDLSYQEALSIQFKTGINKLYRRACVVPPGGVIPEPRLRPGVRQGIIEWPTPLPAIVTPLEPLP